MPVLAVAVGAGGRSGEQGHSGEGSEQQALHRVFGSALRVWALCGGGAAGVPRVSWTSLTTLPLCE